MPAEHERRARLLLLAAFALCACCSCGGSGSSRSAPRAAGAPGRGAEAGAAAPSRPASNVFDEYMDAAGVAPADGFDFPVGDADGRGSYVDQSTGRRHDGWYVATRFAESYSLGLHPGEDWNGAGGGDTDLGQDVRAVAHGRVVFARDCGRLWGNVVVVEHVFYENEARRKIRSVYAHLSEMKVREGDEVRRRQPIATVGQDPDKLYNAHLHLELRYDDTLAPTFWPSSEGKDEGWLREHYAEPSDFIRRRRALFVPQREQALVLVDQESYRMRLYRGGGLQGEYDISLGQGRGPKRVQGDNKTPKGMYFVIQKHRGEFGGEYGEFYGGHWIKINYPNRYDAERGRAEGFIDSRREAQIAARWEQRRATLEDTRLGGGIGFHGWAREWENEGPRHLSWGCVVMHLRDIKPLYEHIPAGAMVVIF